MKQKKKKQKQQNTQQKKISQKHIFGGILLVFVIAVVLANWSTQKKIITRMVTSTIEQPEIIRQSVPAFLQQKKIFDEAFAHPNESYIPDQNVKGVFLSATLAAKEQLAGLFLQLGGKSEAPVFVMLDQVAIKNQPAKIILPVQDLETPYGKLKLNNTLHAALKAQSFSSEDDAILSAEAWTKMLAPFVKNANRNATFLPLFINGELSSDEIKSISETLAKTLPENSILILKATSKISSDPLVADFQNSFMENVLENFDREKYSDLPIAKNPALRIFSDYLTAVKSQKGLNIFAEVQGGAFGEIFMEGPIAKSRTIHMVAFGDLMLGRSVRVRMNANGLDFPFEKMDQAYLQNNDLLVANLEGPIARQQISTTKTIAFRFLPDVVPLLKKYSFDVLSLANNHAYDMGTQGYLDSMDLLKTGGIQPFGDPREVNANSYTVVTIQEEKIAFIGLEDVTFSINEQAVVTKIKELTQRGYTVIPFLHWGIEYVHTPNTRQQHLAHAMIDAGAVAVIGCHPHVVQTYETYKNRPIFYSLGNAMFDQYFSSDTQEGLSIAMAIANDTVEITLLPIRIDNSQMRLMNAIERNSFLKRYTGYGDYSGEESAALLKGKIKIAL